MYRASWVCARADVTTLVDFDLFHCSGAFFIVVSHLCAVAVVFFFAERMKSSLCLVSYFGWPVHSKAGMISTPISSSVSWVEQHWQRQTNKRTNDETIGTMKEERAIVREREIFVFFFLHLNRKAAENAALMMLMMMWCVARRNGKKAKQLSSRSGNSKIRKENKKMWRSRDKQFEWMENRK